MILANWVAESSSGGYGRSVKRKQRLPMSEKLRKALRKALEDIGGEPLAGSEFEDEVPELDFTESDLQIPETPR